MNINLKDKKLLILGATRDECQIVEAAKKMGIYTIVTDNHTNWDDAPAKKIADEGWNVSWSEIELLSKLAKKNNVNGVMAGYSELRIEKAILLSRALGTHFYVEDEAILYKTYDKSIFKNICRTNNVPVTKDYYIDINSLDKIPEDIVFPVVVKPLDNGGSKGIRTCYNKNDLVENVRYALSFSNGKNDSVIVEELIRDAQEVVVYYSFSNGNVKMSAMCDKFERAISTGFNSLPDAYVYPSLHINEYLELHNDNVINALKSMGMKEGSANLQGFYKPGRGFLFFEMDYRPGGTNTYHFTDYFSGENYLKNLILYSLTGKSDDSLFKNADPLFNGNFGCIFTLLSRDGIISKQDGEDEIDSLKNIIHTCFYHKIGTKITVDGSQFPKTFRAYIVGKKIDEIQNTIIRIENTVCVKNENNENMLFPPFDINKLDVYKKI